MIVSDGLKRVVENDKGHCGAMCPPWWSTSFHFFARTFIGFPLYLEGNPVSLSQPIRHFVIQLLAIPQTSFSSRVYISLFQSHWSPCCSSNLPSSFLSVNLCICSSFFYNPLPQMSVWLALLLCWDCCSNVTSLFRFIVIILSKINTPVTLNHLTFFFVIVFNTILRTYV